MANLHRRNSMTYELDYIISIEFSPYLRWMINIGKEKLVTPNNLHLII